MLDIRNDLGKKNRLESLHDAQEIRERAQSMFDLGLLDLRAKARIETIYWQIAESIVEMFRNMRYVPEEVKEMEEVPAQEEKEKEKGGSRTQARRRRRRPHPRWT